MEEKLKFCSKIDHNLVNIPPPLFPFPSNLDYTYLCVCIYPCVCVYTQAIVGHEYLYTHTQHLQNITACHLHIIIFRQYAVAIIQARDNGLFFLI